MAPDLACHFDEDPDPASDLDADADPDPTFHFCADIGSFFNIYWLVICKLMRDPDPDDYIDADPNADPDPAFQCDSDQCGSVSTTLILRPVDELDHMLEHWAGQFEFFTYTTHKIEKLIPKS